MHGSLADIRGTCPIAVVAEGPVKSQAYYVANASEERYGATAEGEGLRRNHMHERARMQPPRDLLSDADPTTCNIQLK